MGIRLQIVEGNILLTVDSEATGRKSWTSWRTADDVGWEQYYIVGTWTRWSFTPMRRDPKRRHIHKYVVRMGDGGSEEFHIVVEKDWNLQLYPDVEAANQGDAVMCGPDKHGHGKDWRICGIPGSTYEITLDTDEQEKSLSVTWRRLSALDSDLG